MSTSTPRTGKAPIRFVLDDDAPGLVRAASLALAVARHCKSGSWLEFAERLQARDDVTLELLAALEVDEADSALVAEHDHVLRLLHVKPLVTVAVCPNCEGWVVVAGTAPTKCKTRLRGCEGAGKPIKASIATKAKPPIPTE